MYFTGPSKTGTDLFKILLPKEFKPKKVMLLDGVIKDATSQKPLAGKVVVYDIKKNAINSLIQTEADGKYQVYLTEGKQYDFSASANEKTYLFYSHFYDLSTMDKYIEVNNNDLKLTTVTLAKNTPVTLTNIFFEPGSAKISDRSTYEIFRIQKLLQDNPTLKIEIASHMGKVQMDTIPNEALTENFTDSVQVKDPADSTGIALIKKAIIFYHNDITQKQADAVVEKLVSKGIAKDRISGKGYGDKKPLIPISSISNPADFTKNQRIELIIK
jgi:outer membrane protein OmpA-like peptidoglycan-associated protein